MADKAIQIQLRCSNCGRVVATLPKDYRLAEELVCPGCGAAIKPPGVIGRLAGELKDALADVPRGRKNEPDEGTDGDRDHGAHDRRGAHREKGGNT